MECKRAYQALSDSRERARYDRGSRVSAAAHARSLHGGLSTCMQCSACVNEQVAQCLSNTCSSPL